MRWPTRGREHPLYPVALTRSRKGLSDSEGSVALAAAASEPARSGCTDITRDYRRRRRAIASRSSASRRLASATTSRTADGRSVSAPSEAATTRNDGPEASGTLAARPRAMNAIKSPAACGVRWKVSTHRSPRQRLTLMNPCAGRQVARRPTPRSSTTTWRPSIGGNSWLLLLTTVTPQWSRDSGGHARACSADARTG